jgi:hypothetical protein
MSFSYLTKNITSFVLSVKSVIMAFLLQENGGYILLEDGGKIILEESPGPYLYQTKHTS